MSALLGDAALLDDQNTVGVVYGAQAVGYDYRRTSLEQGGEGLLHEFLALGVEGRGGLVEDQYLGVAQHGAGDAYALALAAREFRAAVADIGIVALGALHDEVVGVGHACGGLDLFVRDVGAAHGYVVADGVVEEDGILRYDTHVCPEALLRIVSQRDTVY